MQSAKQLSTSGIKKGEITMEKITKYFSNDYENDTTIEYVNTGLYSMLNCSFTSEDPDYGTDTLHYNAEPANGMERMVFTLAVTSSP